MKNFQFLLILIILGSLVFPLISLAGSYTADGKIVTYEGLVPCGTTVKVDGVARVVSCQFCHLIVMLDGVIDFLLLKILFPLALLMLVIAGILYIGAAFEFLPGGFKTLSQAKEIIASVVIGLIVILLGYLILVAFLNIVGLADWARDIYKSGLININCPIKL